jgi:hypothetical protein
VEIDVERAEAQLDALIERRASEAGDLAETANREARAWVESAECYDLRRAAEVRREWCDYHRHMIAVAEDLVDRHREQLGRLIDRWLG